MDSVTADLQEKMTSDVGMLGTPPVTSSLFLGTVARVDALTGSIATQ
jgi:hypothetical protein